MACAECFPFFLGPLGKSGVSQREALTFFVALKGPNQVPRRFDTTPCLAPPTPGLAFVETDSFQSIQVDFIVFCFSAHAFYSLGPLLFRVTAGDEAKPLCQS